MLLYLVFISLEASWLIHDAVSTVQKTGNDVKYKITKL